MDDLTKEFMSGFAKLGSTDKRVLAQLVNTLAAMTAEQFEKLQAFRAQTVDKIPEAQRTKTHVYFLGYAAEAIRQGTPVDELLKEWQDELERKRGTL